MAVVIVLTGVAYLFVYLAVIGNLSIQSGVGRGVILVEDPLSRMFEPGPGRFTYEPIAVVDIGSVRLLFSPIDTVVGSGLAALVGLNLGLSVLAIRRPRACGIGGASGLMASVPALLAGGACCAPVILIVLGVTASGTMLAILPWLLPLGVVLLLSSLVYLVTKIDPGAFAD